jgi:hypothetical protein
VLEDIEPFGLLLLIVAAVGSVALLSNRISTSFTSRPRRSSCSVQPPE